MQTNKYTEKKNADILFCLDPVIHCIHLGSYIIRNTQDTEGSIHTDAFPYILTHMTSISEFDTSLLVTHVFHTFSVC